MVKGGCDDMYFIRKLMKRMAKVDNRLVVLSSILLLGISTYLIVKVEPEQFPSYFDGFWWVMTTVTTVGYGDYYPVTINGRLIAMFLYVFGIGLIGMIIGKVVDAFSVFRKKREEGKIVYKERNHYIIIGWSQKAYYAVKEIMDTLPNAEVVIIDDLEKAPILLENVHYVRGNAANKETLLQANIQEAKAVLIFADDKIQDNQLVDGKTLLIASTAETITPNIHTVVEVMEEEHIKNFKHVKVDEFIFSNETISSLAVRSAFTKGISGVYGQLMRRSQGDDLYHIPMRSHWETYKDAFEELLKEGATLIADRQNLSINRQLDDVIPEEAELYAICDRETYVKITAAEG